MLLYNIIPAAPDLFSLGHGAAMSEHHSSTFLFLGLFHVTSNVGLSFLDKSFS